jgi:hypothetical protein
VPFWIGKSSRIQPFIDAYCEPCPQLPIRIGVGPTMPPQAVRERVARRRPRRVERGERRVAGAHV